MILLYVLAFVVLINCGFYVLFSKFSFLRPSEKSTQHTYPVSVIVCAKNESENLTQHIPLLLQQEYPNFEVILINDASSDNTYEVMEQFAEKDPRVKLVNVENNEAFWGNKKYALTLGIKKAVNKRMLFTDADCRPATKHWLAEMTSKLDQNTQLVLGYGAYEKKKGLLNALIRFETLITATQYFSYAKAGIPYMGVGRNLAYTSQLYYDNQGFMKHIQLPSGDDDLFVNGAATAENTDICFSETSFTISKPKTTFGDWIRQKRRHNTTARLYKPLHKFLLGLYFTSNLFFWLVVPFCIIFASWQITLALVLFRFLVQYIIVGNAAKKLQENKLIPFLPFLELFLVCFQLSIFISNSNKKPTRWK
jgi:glycosyltransferase involved in cell wall biosynthesis|tara:strand:- start:44390 stop:45484 length:1095 start_codon:yes stop_codon:yes gene_type:complete